METSQVMTRVLRPSAARTSSFPLPICASAEAWWGAAPVPPSPPFTWPLSEGSGGGPPPWALLGMEGQVRLLKGQEDQEASQHIPSKSRDPP